MTVVQVNPRVGRTDSRIWRVRLSALVLWATVQHACPAQTTNVYHFERTFTPVAYTSGSPTVYKVVLDAQRLTGIVGPTNIFVRSNETFAIEYEGFAWGYESPNAAWTSALAVYPNYSSNYSGMTYDNAGWLKGTRESYGTQGAFVWLLQNTIAFTSSASSVYVSQDGATSAIASVLVGTLGDYCPQTFVTDTGPVFDTNYPGTGASTDGVYTADFKAYYKLVPHTYLGVNTDDSDSDGVPDYADGYNLLSTNSADDVSPNDFFAVWPLQLSGYTHPATATIQIAYSASSPAGVTTGGGYARQQPARLGCGASRPTSRAIQRRSRAVETTSLRAHTRRRASASRRASG